MFVTIPVGYLWKKRNGGLSILSYLMEMKDVHEGKNNAEAMNI